MFPCCGRSREQGKGVVERKKKHAHNFAQSPGLEQYAMRAFSEALDSVPMALAENSGLSPIETLASIKSRQVTEGNSRLGVDCMQTGSNGKNICGSPFDSHF